MASTTRQKGKSGRRNRNANIVANHRYQGISTIGSFTIDSSNKEGRVFAINRTTLGSEIASAAAYYRKWKRSGKMWVEIFTSGNVLSGGYGFAGFTTSPSLSADDLTTEFVDNADGSKRINFANVTVAPNVILNFPIRNSFSTDTTDDDDEINAGNFYFVIPQELPLGSDSIFITLRLHYDVTLVEKTNGLKLAVAVESWELVDDTYILDESNVVGTKGQDVGKAIVSALFSPPLPDGVFRADRPANYPYQSGGGNTASQSVVALSKSSASSTIMYTYVSGGPMVNAETGGGVKIGFTIGTKFTRILDATSLDDIIMPGPFSSEVKEEVSKKVAEETQSNESETMIMMRQMMSQLNAINSRLVAVEEGAIRGNPLYQPSESSSFLG